VWTPYSTEANEEQASVWLREMSGVGNIVYAHNALFEESVLTAKLKEQTGFIPPRAEQWRCTAAMGRSAALPASLEKLGETLKLTAQKDPKGKALIRKFSIPQTTGKLKGQFINPDDEPEAFKEFCQYCIQDVLTEKAAHKKLADFELEGTPLQTFIMSNQINGRGFPVNLDALHKALRIVDEESGRLEEEFRQLTIDYPAPDRDIDFREYDEWGFPINWTDAEKAEMRSLRDLSTSQNMKVRLWLKYHGFTGDDLIATTVEEALEKAPQGSILHRALTLKKQISYASLKKIPAMINCAGPHDNRVRGTLTFHGAGPGRWSATLVQPQNFKRPTIDETEDVYDAICAGCDAEWLREMYGPPLEMVSSSIRHFIHDTENGDMLDADYAAIEARVIAWQANEEWRLDVFRTHGKIYEASASQMFNVPFSEFERYKKEHGKVHPLRLKGKVAELALGYRGGPGAMEKMGALKQGLTKKELPAIVKAWREASPNIVKLWDETEAAAVQAVRTPNTKTPFGVRCHFICTRTAGMQYLFMVLPSGRRISYPEPMIEKVLVWGETKITEDENGDSVEETVWRKTINPTTDTILNIKEKFPNARIKDGLTIFSQLPKTVHWGRVLTHGGVLVENCIQGIAFDFMAEGALNASKAGYEICALIHDEALSAYHPEKGQSLEEFVALLTKLPAWAEGMPLKAEGDVVKFYRK
jgi:DNA polymerase